MMLLNVTHHGDASNDTHDWQEKDEDGISCGEQVLGVLGY
jgi:hypothetical protein